MLIYVIRYKYSILLGIFIALLSLVPSSTMPDSSLFFISSLDKIVHFSMYAFFLFVALLESRCKERCNSLHLLIALIIFTMSAVLEVLQATAVATRSAEWMDLVANFTGLVGGYLVYRMFMRIRA